MMIRPWASQERRDSRAEQPPGSQKAALRERQPDRVIRKRFGSCLGDQIRSLEAHSSEAGDINSRFERDDVPRDKRLVALGNEIRWLGMTEAHAMPGVMGETVRQFAL